MNKNRISNYTDLYEKFKELAMDRNLCSMKLDDEMLDKLEKISNYIKAKEAEQNIVNYALELEKKGQKRKEEQKIKELKRQRKIKTTITLDYRDRQTLCDILKEHSEYHDCDHTLADSYYFRARHGDALGINSDCIDIKPLEEQEE